MEAPSASTPSNPLDLFRHLAWNRGKVDSSAPLPRRHRGFVYVVREARGLDQVQQACEKVGNTTRCWTLRYRLRSGSTFGTLLQAAMHDLLAIQEGRVDAVRGIAQPAATDPAWGELITPPLQAALADLPDDASGTVGPARVDALLNALENREVLRDAMRLVLLAEVEGADGPGGAVQEWTAAAESLFPRLPERVGLVVSGAPQGFSLPGDPAHFVEVPTVPGAEIGPSGGGESRAKFKPTGFVPDQPTPLDHLDRALYAISTAKFLLLEQTSPPITIGLYGRWGSGKSSFFELLERTLAAEAASMEPVPTPKEPVHWLIRRLPHHAGLEPWAGRLRAWSTRRIARRRIVTVRFNAWQYDDARQTWAGLASTITDALEKALPWWRRYWTRLRYAWREHRADMLLNFGLPFLLLVAAGIFVAYSGPSLAAAMNPASGGGRPSAPDPLRALVTLLVPAASTLLLVWGVGWRLTEVLKPLSARVASYAQRPDYRAEMGYQHRVIEDLKFLLKALKGARRDCRVLVYIDDLDRCSDEKIIEILRATILILASCDLFVMFGVDTEMVRRAIRVHYEKVKIPLADPDAFAESYLRKIIQIPLYLPETTEEQRLGLVQALFSREAVQAYRRRPGQDATPGAGAVPAAALEYDLGRVSVGHAVNEVADTAEELAAIGELKRFLPDNPRELKRFVNVHRFLKILLSASGGAWSVRRQRALVKWLLFCVRWPDRVDDALDAAAADPHCPDCLAVLAAAAEDAVFADFAGAGERVPSADVREGFARAARLSQVVESAPRPVTPAPPRPEIVHLPPEITVRIAGRGAAARPAE